MADWIISSCFLALALILLRYVLRGRLSPRLQYGMWLILLLRLLLPVSFFQSPASISNALPATPPPVDIVTVSIPGEDERRFQSFDESLQYTNSLGGASLGIRFDNSAKLSAAGRRLTGELLWLAGAFILLLLSAALNLRFAAKLRRGKRKLPGIWLEKPVRMYLSPTLTSPCLFGFFSPAIYVPEALAADDCALGHVLAHERAHYRHLDHIWGLLRVLALALHWYNPLVWCAAALSKRDAEAAADAAAVAALGERERIIYGKTLLSLVQRKVPPRALLSCGTSMFGSKPALRERIKLLARKTITARMVRFFLPGLLLLLALCAFTGAVPRPEVSAQPLSPPVHAAPSPVKSSPAAEYDYNSFLRRAFSIPLSDMEPFTGPRAELVKKPLTPDTLASGKLEDGRSVFLYAEGSCLYAACDMGWDILRCALTDRWRPEYFPVLTEYKGLLGTDGLALGYRTGPLERAELFLFVPAKEGFCCLARIFEGYRSADANYDGVNEIFSYSGGDGQSAPRAVYYCLRDGKPSYISLSGLLCSGLNQADLKSGFPCRHRNPLVQTFSLSSGGRAIGGEYRFGSGEISCWLDELYFAGLDEPLLKSTPIVSADGEYYYSCPVFKPTASYLGSIGPEEDFNCDNPSLEGASVWREQDSGEHCILVFYNELHYRFERRQ